MKRLFLFVFVVFSMTSIVFSTNITLQTDMISNTSYINYTLELKLNFTNSGNVNYSDYYLTLEFEENILEFDSSNPFEDYFNNTFVDWESDFNSESSTVFLVNLTMLSSSNTSVEIKLYDNNLTSILNDSIDIEIDSIVINQSNSTENETEEQGKFTIEMYLDSDLENVELGDEIDIIINISNPTNKTYENLVIETTYDPRVLEIDDSNEDYEINESEETFAYEFEIDDFEEKIIKMDFEVLEIGYLTLDLAAYDNETFLLSYSLEVDIEDAVTNTEEDEEDENNEEDSDEEDEFNIYMNDTSLKNFIASSLGFSTISIEDIKKPYTREYTKASSMEFNVLKSLSQENPYFVVELEKRNETRPFIRTVNKITVDFYEVNVSGTIYNLTVYNTEIEFDLDGSETDMQIIQHIPMNLVESTSNLSGNFETIFDSLILFSRHVSDIDENGKLNFTYTLKDKQLNYYNLINTFVFANIDESLLPQEENESIENETEEIVEDIVIDETETNETLDDDVFSTFETVDVETVETEEIEADINDESETIETEESGTSFWMMVIYFIGGLLILDTVYHLAKKRQEENNVVEEVVQDVVQVAQTVEEVVEDAAEEFVESFDDIFEDELDPQPTYDYEVEFDELYFEEEKK